QKKNPDVAELVRGKTGRVYAVDTNQELLAFITKHASEKGVTNIVPFFAESTFPDLLQQMVDFIFMRNVTHHISNRVEYFTGLKKILKPDGRLAIIEYDGRGGFFSFQRLHRHFVPPSILQGELKQAGFMLLNSYDFLSDQSFTIFGLK
ncbi:MAG: methyltransferase domain-containing protein, partial [Candidatus Thermoplasmatota archaeon]|nr:methyltransferase domain-containing protein [Candidatus Thermoplasmatota archaeon]